MELVIVKYGGGLITDKSRLCQANIEAIEAVTKEAIKILVANYCKYRVIVVHGAGSFGHLKAKKWRLNEGKLETDFEFQEEDDDLKSQEEAVEAVRHDMKTLCHIVSKSLVNNGLKCQIFHPHTWASGTGSSFKGDLGPIMEAADQNVVIPVLHGDVVDIETDMKFGILSGDDIATRLVLEATGYHKVHMIFAMTDAPGLMTLPPGEPEAVLIPVWHPGDSLEGLKHHEHLDVTGGIRLKLESAARMTQKYGGNVNIWIVDGRKPERLVEAVTHCDTIGTCIKSG
jgi:isopentenyl phosphate kinase